jgi:cation diffusion facilitator family transporter
MASELTPGQRNTALASIAAAAALVALKLGTGLLTGSLALVSAGVESSGDVIAAALTFFAVRLGARPADPGHPYGHRRAENLAALGEAAIVGGGAVIITYEAVSRLVEGDASPPDTGWYVFAVIGVAVAIDLARITASLRAARRYGSAAFRSNAFHFAGDLGGSLAVLLGMVLVASGVEQGDPIAALLVSAIIAVGVARLIWENAGVLMDRAPDAALGAAREAITGLGPDVELRRLRLRESAGRFFVDVTVGVPPGAAVVEGHQQADRIEEAVNEALPDSDVVVHMEPRHRGVDLRQQVLSAALSEPEVAEAHDVAIFEGEGRATVSLHLKFPADLPLEEAHAVAERVEDAIRSLRGVEAVLTHLEPLERPVPESHGDRRELAGRRERIEELVRERTGAPPRHLRLLPTEAGYVLFLTLGLDDEHSLPAAHALATELEDALRRQQPDLAEVVVHTEPA